MPTTAKNLDEIDRKILRQMQRDCTLSIAALAEMVHLSTNACWRRLKALRDNGVIAREVAILDHAKIDKEMTVFVLVRTREHSETWLQAFSDGIRAIADVLEFHRLNGDFDYLLKIAVADVSDYDRVYKKLIRTVPLFDVSSYFSMECIKDTTEVPI